MENNTENTLYSTNDQKWEKAKQKMLTHILPYMRPVASLSIYIYYFCFVAEKRTNAE